MTVGIVILAHRHFDRVAEVARHWVKGGCPVVIHVDRKVPRSTFTDIQTKLNDPKIKFSKRHTCEWGMWGLVSATQDACELLLRTFPDVGHVYLCSGSCVPLRPVQELQQYLTANADVDFIESARADAATWAIDGLEMERFTLRFPFSWRKRRKLFDRYVDLQRFLKVKRTIPAGLTPHIGSQWWCLTRQTLSAILKDPKRPRYDQYFRRVWIPDEAYFQTLTRVHSRTIQNRSLTLAKFDNQGKPHIFYDDHIQLLQRSDCFVARKMWHKADKVYDSFLRTPERSPRLAEPQPAKIDGLFAKAKEQRVRGRAGLSMQSRWLNEYWHFHLTAQKYTVFEGFSDLFINFNPWISNLVDVRVHGHIFAKDRVEFADNEPFFCGMLSDNAAIRDYNAQNFLRTLIWNTRGEQQCFHFGPFDATKHIHWDIAKDPNAHIHVISGAWLLRLFRSKAPMDDILKQASACQEVEQDHIGALRSRYSRARVRIWTLAEFLENVPANLKTVLEDTHKGAVAFSSQSLQMHDLSGLGAFVNTLANHGMHITLLGDFREVEDQHILPHSDHKT